MCAYWLGQVSDREFMKCDMCAVSGIVVERFWFAVIDYCNSLLFIDLVDRYLGECLLIFTIAKFYVDDYISKYFRSSSFTE